MHGLSGLVRRKIEPEADHVIVGVLIEAACFAQRPFRPIRAEIPRNPEAARHAVQRNHLAGKRVLIAQDIGEHAVVLVNVLRKMLAEVARFQAFLQSRKRVCPVPVIPVIRGVCLDQRCVFRIFPADDKLTIADHVRPRA